VIVRITLNELRAFVRIASVVILLCGAHAVMAQEPTAESPTQALAICVPKPDYSQKRIYSEFFPLGTDIN